HRRFDARLNHLVDGGCFSNGLTLLKIHADVFGEVKYAADDATGGVDTAVDVGGWRASLLRPVDIGDGCISVRVDVTFSEKAARHAKRLKNMLADVIGKGHA